MMFLLIIIPVAMVCLRAAVALANRFLGPRPETDQPLPEEFVASYTQPPDPDNPYSAPGHFSVSAERVTNVIPEPNFGRAAIMVVIQFVAVMLLGYIPLMYVAVVLLGSRGGVGLGLMAWIILVLPGMACLAAVVLKFMLPTTFRYGLLVAFLQIVIVAAFCASVAGIISVLVNQ
jgi:hypothetical protein